MRLPALALFVTLTALPVAVAAGAANRSSQRPQGSAATPISDSAGAVAAAIAEAGNAADRERLVAQHATVPVEAVIQALIGLGARARNEAESDLSERSFTAALQLAERRHLQPEMGRALEGLGTLAFERGQYSDARTFLDRSLAIGEAIERRELIASALNHRASVRFRQGDLAGALADARRALTVGEPAGIAALTAASLSAIGMVLRNQGHLDEALAHYERALPLAERGGDPVVLARLLNNMGVAENVRGHHDRTLTLYERSLQISEQARFRWGIAQVLSNIGNIYVGLGDNATALEYLQRSARESDAIGERRTAAFTSLMVGQVHRSQGRHDLALEYFDKGRERAEAIGEQTFTALATRYAGGVHLARQDFARARQAFEASLALYQTIGNREGIGDAYQSLSSVYEASGDLDAALDFARKSLATRDPVQDRRTWPMAWLRLGALQLARGDDGEALASASRALETAASTGHATRVWPAQVLSGQALRALGRRDEAKHMFRDAIATIESLRTQTAGGEPELQRAFERHVAPYHELGELLLEDGLTLEALGYAERAKGRVLLDVLHRGRINITRAMTETEQQRERELDATVGTLMSLLDRQRQRPSTTDVTEADLQRRLEKARLQADAYRAELYAAHPELRAQRGEAPAMTPEQLLALPLDANTAILEYVLTARAAYLFVIVQDRGETSTTISVHRLEAAGSALDADVRRFRERLEARDLGFRPSARALYDRLLGPARSRLRGRTNLVIVPDGALWEMPFAALMDPGGRFVPEQHVVTLVSSITVWRELQRRRAVAGAPAPSLLALGNPSVPAGRAAAGAPLRSPALVPLPAAEREVQRIAAIYGRRRSQTMVGAAAREDRLKQEAANHNILHIASHGVLDNVSPLYSYLALAPGAPGTGQQEDGRLSAREILGLTLRAELAVLSACETARGQVGAGEGMIGLTWAFFIAGVPTTVVSQWRVDSNSTAELMVRFHRQLTDGAGSAPVSMAAALRESALALLATDRYRHPFYWAGFVVIGDGLRTLKGRGAVTPEEDQQ